MLIAWYNKHTQQYFGTQWFTNLSFLFINFLPHFNSTLNPFIYVISNAEFLTVLKSFYKRVSGSVLKKVSGSVLKRKSVITLSQVSSFLMGDNNEDGVNEKTGTNETPV